MRRWVIADSHLWHGNIAIYCDRPKDFSGRIIDEWMTRVAPQDIVYHLGDVAFNKTLARQVLPLLPGHKILIRGNHDKASAKWFRECGFEQIFDRGTCWLLNERVMLSHKPVPISDSVKLQIHGHLHNNDPNNWGEASKQCLTDRHRLLSIEWCNYRPVLLDEVIAGQHAVPTLDVLNRTAKVTTVAGVKRLVVRGHPYDMVLKVTRSP